MNINSRFKIIESFIEFNNSNYEHKDSTIKFPSLRDDIIDILIKDKKLSDEESNEFYDLLLSKYEQHQYDIDKVIKKSHISDKYKLNLSGFANGVYILTLQNQKEYHIYKLIIQR